MNKHKFTILLIFVVILNIGLFFSLENAYASCVGNATPACSGRDVNACTGPCEWFPDGGGTTENIVLPNPLGTSNPDINTIIGTAINAILGLVGSIALVMFIYGGFTWMTASGNKEAVTKGKDIIIWSVAGLAVIFLAYAVVNFILTDVIASMGTSGG